MRGESGESTVHHRTLSKAPGACPRTAHSGARRNALHSRLYRLRARAGARSRPPAPLSMELQSGAGLRSSPGYPPGCEHFPRHRVSQFPLNERRFHWQSKARTTRDSNEGRRHLDPVQYGVTPLLFVRERADDRPGVTMAFQYLGPVDPDRDEGERPITIEWKLRYAMPREVLAAGRIAG